MTFKDGYGAQLDRNGACHDPESSVVVMITDTCPCHYPGNAYSNKRWCCGGESSCLESDLESISLSNAWYSMSSALMQQQTQLQGALP
jgi:hypothetical protein